MMAFIYLFILFYPNSLLSEEKSKILWDEWYTVTIENQTHYGYYHDKVEILDHRIFFQNHYWKKEEGFINEEHLGAYSENTSDLKPLIFNFHTQYRTTAMTIDGSLSDGNLMTLKIKKGQEEGPSFKKSLPKKLILAIFFPVWLGKNLSTFKPGVNYPFKTLLEDGADPNFNPVSGWVRLEKTKKITVNYRNNLSTWTVDKKGMPLKIEMPTQKVTVQKVSEKVAKGFLVE